MTNSEAIEKLRAYLKCRSLQVKGIYEDCNEQLCDNCDLCYAQGTVGEHIKSIEIGIQALEKQISKKRDNYSCPICSHYFEDGECFTYCPECGQRLE